MAFFDTKRYKTIKNAVCVFLTQPCLLFLNRNYKNAPLIRARPMNQATKVVRFKENLKTDFMTTQKGSVPIQRTGSDLTFFKDGDGYTVGLNVLKENATSSR